MLKCLDKFPAYENNMSQIAPLKGFHPEDLNPVECKNDLPEAKIHMNLVKTIYKKYYNCTVVYQECACS